MFVEVMGLGC